MIWECDGCGACVESDPLSHSDTGGVTLVQGPHCEACDAPMAYLCEGRIEGDTIIEEDARDGVQDS